MRKKKNDPFKKVVRLLKKDKDLRESWRATIVTSIIDCEALYKKQSGKKSLNRHDKHRIYNLAAEHFLKLLCGQIKVPKGR